MASSDVWNNAVMGRVAVSVSLGLALLLSGCSSGGEVSNVPTTTAVATTTAVPTTTEGGLTPAEKAWIDTQIEEERRKDGGLLDQFLAGPGLTETEFSCMLGSLLDRWGLDDLRRVWPGYAPNPYSDMAEGYVRSFVEAIGACTDLRKAIRDGVDPQTPIDVVDCWMGEVSDEVVIEMSVLTFEYEMGLGSDGSELMQFIQLEFWPPLMQCAEELLSPEEFSEFFERDD